MKRLVLLFASLLACDEPTPGSDDGVGPGAQPGCVPSECQAESMRYQMCLNAACDGQYTACYGPDHARNIYNGGPCSAWQTCIESCGCSTTCQTSCGQAPLTCLDCVGGALQVCMVNANCAPLNCVVDAGTGNLGACNRLAQCCGSLVDQGQRATCSQLYTNLSPAGDDVCAGVIPTFCK